MRAKTSLTFVVLVTMMSQWCIAQTRTAPPPNKPTVAREKGPSDSKTPAILRQQRALALLDDLTAEMRLVDSKESRILMKAQIGDALWDHNPAKGRQYLGDAVSEMIDILATKASNRVSPATGNSEVSRLEVVAALIKLASKRDPGLVKQLAEVAAPKSKSNGVDPISALSEKERSQQYSQFASSVLDTNLQLSTELASEGVGREIDTAFIAYLVKVRAKNASAATDLFAQTLSRLSATSPTWARSVDYLAMYALPNYGPPAMRENLGLAATGGSGSESGVHLLRTVCEVASRDLRMSQTGLPPGESDLPKNAILLSQLLLRLVPYYERQMPECAPTIRTRAESTLKLIPSTKLQEQLVKSTQTPSVEELLSQASSVKTKEEQDQLIMLSLLQIVEKGEWDRALQIASMFSSESLRTRWTSEIGYRASLASIDIQDVDAVMRYARLITSLASRTDIFVRLASSLSRHQQSDRALEILRSAKELALKSEDESMGADALLLISSAASTMDGATAFEYARTAIVKLNASRQSAVKAVSARPGAGRKSTRLEETLFSLARVDFDESIDVARLIEDKTLSIQCRIEICRSTLTSAVPKISGGPALDSTQKPGKSSP